MRRPPKFVHGFIDWHGRPRFYFRRAGFKQHVAGIDDFEVAEATYRAVKRLGSPYRSGRSRDWLKMKNPSAPAVNVSTQLFAYHIG
jgi:hypothetical protein